MPKISGSNIPEHVAAQEEAIVEAATELIAERGVNRVRLSDIAEAVGLARTSLYRYFPTKTSILHHWFETAMTPLIDASSSIATSSASRDDRLRDWIDLQLDFLDVEHNQAMIAATREADDMSNEVRAQIAERHRDLYTTLYLIVATRDTETPDIDTPDIEAATHVRVLLIAGLLRGVGDLREQALAPAIVRREVQRAAGLIAK
jgi:AcrR family transcriptional regulator